MVLMVIDHVRDFFSNVHFDPTDLGKTTPALFVTRAITHHCAPVSCFLAGTGAYLSSKRGKSKRELSTFLATRGLWLVVLELTLVRFGWPPARSSRRRRKRGEGASCAYGDAHASSVEPRPLFTVFSFVSTTKYPPSLLYLLMTLGPALFLLGAFERARGSIAGYGTQALSFGPDNLPADHGYGLPVVYAVWAAVVLMLYPACRWFADLKRRRRDLTWIGYF